LVGNFNSWNPNDSNSILVNNGDGKYQITISPPIGTFDFKFTRGNWASVEVGDNGQDIPNRSISYTGKERTVNVTIAKWKKNETPKSTAARNVSILDENFPIPQLNRTRRIWVYLPPGYDSSSKSYPVLYMQDGQNLFDARTSFSGEWKVDEWLNAIIENGHEGVIVVGIDNGGEHRITEYSPWVNSEYGGGEGELYADFITQTLKPHIDSIFRTKPDRLNTGIMGSSLGASISFYAAIKHQDVFSKVGVFSPSFWFSDSVYTLVQSVGKQYDMRFYFMGGNLESDDLIPNMNKMVQTLNEVGFDSTEVLMVSYQDGEHSEWFWSRGFREAFLWLFE